MNIYVGNLPYSITEEELRAVFAEYGELARVSVITDRGTGRSKGFGFVEMPDDGEADTAIEALNESALDGRNLKVKQARPRANRHPRRSRYPARPFR